MSGCPLFPLPILLQNGERVRVRGRRLLRRLPLPLTPTLSPQKSGEREKREIVMLPNERLTYSAIPERPALGNRGVGQSFVGQHDDLPLLPLPALLRGEGRGEGQRQAPEQASAPHPN